jgi:hypothetical protein
MSPEHFLLSIFALLVYVTLRAITIVAYDRGHSFDLWLKEPPSSDERVLIDVDF